MDEIVLFHNAMSTCSQKVRLVLEEKGLDWTSKEVNLLAGEQRSENYLRINPNGVVPVIQMGGKTIIESTIINEFIEDLTPTPSFLPIDPASRAHARRWPKLIDDGVHGACGAITFGTIMRNLAPRDLLVAQADADPNPFHRAARLSLIEEGANSPAFKEALNTLVRFLDEIDGSLTTSSFLSGETIGLADFAATPYVLRLQQFGLTRLWEGGARPGVARWFSAVQERPAFDRAVTKWLSPPALQVLGHAGEVVKSALGEP